MITRHSTELHPQRTNRHPEASEFPTALYCIYACSRNLYSPLTTGCYVQFPPILHPPPSALRLPSMQPDYPPPHPPKLTKCICQRLPLETAPLHVSYVRQDCTPDSVNLPVTLYIWQPWFLMHSGLEGMSAMSSKTGCPFALTLRIRGS